MQPNSNSSIAAIVNYQCRKGDTFRRHLTFRNDDGTARDMTDYVFVLTVKNSAGSTVLTFSGGDWTGTPASGLITFSKSAATMAGIAAGVYVYDLQVTYPDATVITYMHGKFVVDSDITTA